MAGRVVETDWKVVFPLKIRIFGPKSAFAQFEDGAELGQIHPPQVSLPHISDEKILSRVRDASYPTL